MVGSWYQRFVGATRGRLIALLRRDAHTVDELAQQLQLTDNAVRAHLTALERDGLVRQRGVRRSGAIGKPAFAYDLTPEAEQLFPKPYAAVLDGLLTELGARLTPDEIEALLRESGRRLAGQDERAGEGDLRARLAVAAEALTQMGGLAEVEECEGALSIRGYGCPLSELTPTHPEVCRLAASFVGEVAGTPMQECCDRGEAVRCRFAPLDPREPNVAVESAKPA